MREWASRKAEDSQAMRKPGVPGISFQREMTHGENVGLTSGLIITSQLVVLILMIAARNGTFQDDYLRSKEMR